MSTSRAIQALLNSPLSWDPDNLRKGSHGHDMVDVTELILQVSPGPLLYFITLKVMQIDIMLKELEKQIQIYVI